MLLSIVIANYNYGNFLATAIESILSQSCRDFELIVVDGGSTDNSVEVIKRYAEKIKWWVSEPDEGQSDAFNKGFSHASGKFLTWLNADDVMLPQTIEKLRIAADKNPKCEWFSGGVIWVNEEMDVIRCSRARRLSRLRARYGIANVYGPSSFFTKDMYIRAGKIDKRFIYTMDSDLWLRFALNEDETCLPFTDYAWCLRLHPMAKMSGHNFDKNGKLLKNAFTSEAQKRDREKSFRLNIEREMIEEKIQVRILKNMPTVVRLMSTAFIPAFMSAWDSFIHKGKYCWKLRKDA